MRILFCLCAVLIGAVYYVGVSQDVKALNQGMSSLLFVFRNVPGQFVDSTIVTEKSEEEETPYYLPPGLPKEEKDVVYS